LKNSNSLNNFDFKNIFKINESLNYSKDEPFWYINQPLTKSSIGPISSTNLEKMYKDNLINLFTDIRMIDIFNINSNFSKKLNNNNSNFEYLQLCEYTEKIIENLIPSTIVKKSLIENKVYKIKIDTNNSSEFLDFKIIKKSNPNVNEATKENNNSYLISPMKNDINTKGPIIRKNDNSQIQTNLFNRNNNNPVKTFNVTGLTRPNFSPKKDQNQKLDISIKNNDIINEPHKTFIPGLGLGVNKSPNNKAHILKPNIPTPTKKTEGKFIFLIF